MAVLDASSTGMDDVPFILSALALLLGIWMSLFCYFVLKKYRQRRRQLLDSKDTSITSIESCKELLESRHKLPLKRPSQVYFYDVYSFSARASHIQSPCRTDHDLHIDDYILPIDRVQTHLEDVKSIE